MPNPQNPLISRRAFTGLAPALLALGLTGCGAGGASGDANSSSSPEAARTITHDLGEAVVNGTPKRIVSTSVVLTGTLLALDAPVVGSGASKPNSEGFDDVGFFTHWSAIAKERDVKALYANNKLDIEAVTAAKPDLIIIAPTGNDSTKDDYDSLSKIAPTVAINYNSESWQAVTRQVADVTGTQAKAEELVKTFDAKIAELKAGMTGVPAEPVQAIVYTPSKGLSFAKPGGPHDEIFAALGFKLAEAPASSGEEGANRKDFVFATVEQSVQALTSDTLLLVSGDEKTVEQLKADSNYNTTKTVSSGKLVPLGISSFKLDYYSALAMAETLAAAYAK
jgi:hypothetical protein